MKRHMPTANPIFCPPRRRPLPIPTLFAYTTLFRSVHNDANLQGAFLFHVNLQGAKLVGVNRSEEHTSELQSHSDLVCRLLLEKKNLTYYRALPHALAPKPAFPA